MKKRFLMTHFYTFLMMTLIAVSSSAFAQTENDATSQRVEHVVATLVSSHDAFTENDTVRIGVRLDMDPHWHVYYINPGDSGLPPEADWTLPEGFTVGDFSFPTPEIIPIEPLTNYGYEDSVTLLAPLTMTDQASQGDVTLSATVSWLMCKDICLPGEATLTKTVAYGDDSVPSEEAARFPTTEDFPAPDSGLIAANMLQTAGHFLFPLSDPAFSQTLRFIPAEEGTIEDSAPQTFINLDDGRMALQVVKDKNFPTDASTVQGIFLTFDTGIMVGSEQVTRALPTLEITPVTLGAQNIDLAASGLEFGDMFSSLTVFQMALLFAFLGGLILNLMPCVLPVLALKVFSLIQHAGSGRAFLHGLTFTFGVLIMMSGLAGIMIFLTQAGEAIGWGFQLQNPYFVSGLALLMFLVSYNMFGLFSFGDRLTQLDSAPATQSKHSLKSTLGGGALMVLVATPCTAPFMGAAMGYAFTLTPIDTLAIFAMLGLGLAFPYLFLTIFPPLIRSLPKPGPWMITFKQFLGFPMLATALWLMWVFTQLVDMDASFIMFVVLFLLTFFVWCYGRMMTLSAGIIRKFFALILLGVGLGIFAGYSLNAIPDSPIYNKVPEAISKPVQGNSEEMNALWTPCTKESFYQSLERGESVFVNMTADWCITCKVNERTSLSSEAVLDAFKQNNVTLYKGDWTKFNADITQILETYGRKGVPLYLYYPAGEKDAIVLPQILTPAIVTSLFE